jgi:molybdenum cofactor synthesis domain-containing protein
MLGRVEALCTSTAKGVRKQVVSEVHFAVDTGVVGDAHVGTWHRQVSLLAAEDVTAFQRRGGLQLAPGAFAENLLVSGIDLNALGLGSRLRIGEQVLLTITQRGKTCHNRCAIYHQTGDCIMPRLGLFARVVASGRVAVNDPVRVETHVPRALAQAVVITASDRCSRGETEDTAGPAVADLLRSDGHFHLYATEIHPDDRETLATRLRHYSDGHSIDLVIIAGGTGFAPRDVTPEAVRDVVDRLTPGLDEAMRAASLAQTPFAVLSRAVSGIRRSTLIVSLPGSRKAAVENLSTILPALPHAIDKLRGDPTDCGRPPAP